ncbi:MAG TPA: transglycosylase domain-containing protein [Chthoniobacterales bacterium]|nr:transglycosylase domain-containing protein [Chthoniobacterales bacterium]
MPVSLFPRRSVRHWDDPPWYKKPQFYLPAAGLLVILIGVGIYGLILASGLSRQAEVYDLNQLEQMESASVIVDRNDKIFGQIYVENRETVAYDQLPRHLVNAVVAMEDTKFYQHSGYDLFGIIRAALKNFTAGQVRQGASTVTQQLARNTFELKERTFRRKLLEVFLARRIEERFGKQKIMELYLNRIYFGGGLYGAEAAARGYFEKPAREMTLAECATLAGLIKSPNRLSPWSDRQGSRDARNVVLGRMRDLGFITPVQCTAAQAEKVVIGSRQSAQGQTYAVEYIRQQVIAAVGWDRAMAEGYRIHTTIDSELQKVAEDSLRANLDRVEQTPGYEHETYATYAAQFKAAKQKGKIDPNDTPDYLQGAVIALENKTGGILALVGGRDFEHSQYDRALQAKRPAGTAMQPFVYAAAFEKGLFPGTVVEDSALDNRAVMIGGTTGILGEWGPERADNRYEGPITARAALAKSKNGATVRLGMMAGVDAFIQLCKAGGIKSPLRPYPASFLGSSVVTLAELALAYTSFPNGGTRADVPFILDRIEAKDGSIVWQSEQKRTQERVMKPETAYEVNSCLVDALNTGTGAGARSKLGLQEFPAAGKTGTAYDFTEVMFAGYDSVMTVAVRAGFDKPQKIYRGAFGSDIALPVWVDIMNASVARYPARELPKPAGLETVEICSKSGLLATDKCPAETTYREIATKEQMPTDPCNVHGDARTRIVRDLPDAGVPRASLAVATDQVKPVTVKGPTLLAESDPYNAIRSTVKPPQPEEPADNEVKPAIPVTDPGLSPTPEDPNILRAEPVQPGETDASPADEEEVPAKALPAEPVEPVLRAEPVDPNQLQPSPRFATPADPNGG